MLSVLPLCGHCTALFGALAAEAALHSSAQDDGTYCRQGWQFESSEDSLVTHGMLQGSSKSHRP